MVVLLGAWALVWGVTPRESLAGPWQGFLWWTAMKGLVWFALGALVFRPAGLRSWVGEYRGRGGLIVGLAVLWVLLDVAAVRGGFKPAAASPFAGPRWIEEWNAWLNVLVLAPVLEELLFRGLFWSALSASGLRAGAVWGLSATAFALLHVPGWLATQGASGAIVQQLALVFFVGLFCGAGRWLSGSVWPAVLLHLVNNAASVGLFLG